MRWIAFAILLYVVTVLQTTLAPFIAVHTIRPDFMLILAVNYALMVRSADALLACWCIGFAIDLTGISYTNHSNIGVHALSLGLIALAIVNIRELTFRESPVTQLVTTFIVKLVVALLAGIHMLYVLDQWDRFGEVLTLAFWAAVYTSAISPYGHWILRRIRRPLGIGTTHRLHVP